MVLDFACLKAGDVDVVVAHAGARQPLPGAVLVKQGHQVGPDGVGQVVDVHILLCLLAQLEKELN